MLVCCTGGEEGELQNPTLREPGQPFHGLSPEEEKALVASMRPAELEASAAAIGFDEVVMLGYRDSGMAESERQPDPDCFWQADIDEATGPAGRGDPAHAAAGDHHLQRRPAGVPASRPPARARHLGAGVRPRRRPRLVSRSGRAVAAVEALLHDVEPAPAGGDPRGADEAARRVAVRRAVVRASRPRPSHHDPDRGRAVPVGAHEGAAGPRHAGRPDRGLLVRAQRRPAGRDLPVRGLDPGALDRRTDPRAADNEFDLFEGVARSRDTTTS